MPSRRKTLEETLARFWSKVDTSQGCWLWKGLINAYGYGTFSLNSKGHIASRWIYEHLYGPAGEMVVDHVCNTRHCVNPYHLRAITNKANLLRGVGIAAKCARKTHCKNGHEFTPENTYVWKGTDRHCRTCHRQRETLRNQKKQSGHSTC